MHQHPGPAVVHRLLGQQVAEHGAARRGIGLDDQHLTLAGFAQQFPYLGIVVRAAHRGYGAVEVGPPAIVAEQGGADLGLIPPFVAQISCFQAMQCHGQIPKWGLRLWFTPRGAGYRVTIGGGRRENIPVDLTTASLLSTPPADRYPVPGTKKLHSLILLGYRSMRKSRPQLPRTGFSVFG